MHASCFTIVKAHEDVMNICSRKNQQTQQSYQLRPYGDQHRSKQQIKGTLRYLLRSGSWAGGSSARVAFTALKRLHLRPASSRSPGSSTLRMPSAHVPHRAPLRRCAAAFEGSLRHVHSQRADRFFDNHLSSGNRMGCASEQCKLQCNSEPKGCAKYSMCFNMHGSITHR